VTLWDRLAENAAKYLRKGSPVFVEGRLKLDTWEDKESGQNRQRLRVVADRMQFLGGPGAGRQESAEGGSEADPGKARPKVSARDAGRAPDDRGAKPRRATFA
jgi:single-strand DNA-binding protein